MKLPHKQLSKSKTLNQDQDQEQDQSQLHKYGLQIEQIKKTFHTISKLKKISKENLTKLKKKQKPVNQLFHIMSEFFVTNSRKTIEQRKLQKAKRIQARRKAILNKVQNINMQLDPQQIYLPQLQQCDQIQLNAQPQITQVTDNIDIQNIPIKNSVCYICSKQYSEIDELYHQHCPTCSAFSKEKRFQTANLAGMTALVTGARIKIGYEITLKLLRDGAIVYATTRFTKDALLRYLKQQDYQQFKDRLFLIQCDFLSSQQVGKLIQFIKQNVSHLDILIHNAAQTLARPVQFFTFQLQNQQKQIQFAQKHMITFPTVSQPYPSLQGQNIKAISNAEASQIDLTHIDQFGQPLDLRPTNTWKQKIQDVSLFDCLSTQIINSTVPFYITGQLRCVMGGDKPSWVINVSSMEGVFYRQNKTCYHPHTNMAKASLNMITRTCAPQFAKNNIYMSSVDTGWVTNQNPFVSIVRMKIKHDFTPPLDCIQGAMRVLDPIYQGVNKGQYIFGKFLKDYKESAW